MKANSKGVLGIHRNNYYENRKDSTISTPEELSNFIFDIIFKKYSFNNVLDIGTNDGILLSPWKTNASNTIGIDIQNNKKRKHCEKFYKLDFLTEDQKINNVKEENKIDLILCNPPFNWKSIDDQIENHQGKGFLPEMFFKRIIEFFPGIPLVLFAPHGFRLNVSRTSKRLKWFIENKIEIDSIISIPLDTFKVVKFHSEILLFNLPKMKPHYFFNY